MFAAKVQRMSVCVEEEEDGADCVGFRSNQSKAEPLAFRDGPGPSDTR